MTRTLFNDEWSYRTKLSVFSELGGGPSTSWSDVTLPHDAIIDTERSATSVNASRTGYFNGGFFEYRRMFDVRKEQAGELIVLEFDGVYRNAMVYVNGTLAGQRAFGYSRFSVRIDPYLRFGATNEIRVECRSHEDARWYSGAGIYRDVHLVTKPAACIAVDGVRIHTVDCDTELAVLEVETAVENRGQTTETLALRAAVDEGGPLAAGRWAHSPITLLPGERALVRLRLVVDEPRLWSVDNPQLSNVTVELLRGETAIDREMITTGIRSLQLDPRRGLRINGREVKLRGACVHHDNGPLGSATIARAEERRVELLKAAGFNAIRSSHNPMSSAMLDACDRLGMLVMDEAFDMWTSSKVDHDYASSFSEWWERDLEAMVAKDINHPSVVMYSIGNEIPEAGTPFGANLGRKLAEKIRALDPTRYVTNGINGFVSTLDEILNAPRDDAPGEPSGGVNTMMAQLGTLMRHISASDSVTTRTEESFAVLDIAGMNYGDGRYELDRELFPDRIIVGTETFPTQIAENWALVSANPQILGDFTWTGWDYLGESGLGGVDYATSTSDASAVSVAHGYPWLAAWCGDIDIIGTRRPMSYYRETVFGLRTAPYIAVQRPQAHNAEVLFRTPWSWSDTISGWSWPSALNQQVAVEVYSTAEEIELSLNGETLGRAVVGVRQPFAANFDVPYAPGELIARAFAGGQVVGEASIASAGPERLLHVEPDRTQLRADTTDLAFVMIALTDRLGNVHVEASLDVTVVVEGAGSLQALGSGDPKALGGYAGPSCQTFDGRLLAIVRPSGVGPITVTVTADGLAPVTVDLDARSESDAVTAPSSPAMNTFQSA